MRPFGIELEFSKRLVYSNLNTRNTDDVWETICCELDSLCSSGKLAKPWRVKTDTSCGGEIVSTPMKNEEMALRDIRTVCAKMEEIARVEGQPLVDNECGLHIHYDASDLTPKVLSRIFTLLHVLEPIIYAMFSKRNTKYCRPLDVNILQASRFRDWYDVRDAWYRDSNKIEGLGNSEPYTNEFINSSSPGNHYDSTRYHGFNIHCYWIMGTLEFRYAYGSFDPVFIWNYYKMCKQVIDRAFSKAPIKVNTKNGVIANSIFRYRSYLIETCKQIGFDRNIIRFIKSQIELDKQSATRLKKRSSKPEIRTNVINEVNKHKFVYYLNRSMFYHDGTKVDELEDISEFEKVHVGLLSSGTVASLDSRYIIDTGTVLKLEGEKKKKEVKETVLLNTPMKIKKILFDTPYPF